MTSQNLIAVALVATFLAGCTGGNQSMGREAAPSPATGVSVSGEAVVGVSTQG
ncbi:hypothetical protein [Roseobacter ponti]|uniref:Uncharacterized protein n=1 Tax=Roseobacter ponti TaxID=1891787 RepID=A0A858SZY8_9RHOB|nr:hypothetical protein [Roseobacter ponti]QJF52476.1 hypothetical protein G3256_15505 [Roseobacter ponti]